MSSERDFDAYPRWFQQAVPVFGLVLAGLAFYYVADKINSPDLDWRQWIRIVFIALMSGIFLISAFIGIFRKKLGWSWLVGGLALIPVLLMLQLILFVIYLVQSLFRNVLEGRLPEPIRQFIENYPSKFDIVILAVMAIFVIVWLVRKLQRKT